jgi:hypothetical protein
VPHYLLPFISIDMYYLCSQNISPKISVLSKRLRGPGGLANEPGRLTKHCRLPEGYEKKCAILFCCCSNYTVLRQFRNSAKCSFLCSVQHSTRHTAQAHDKIAEKNRMFLQLVNSKKNEEIKNKKRNGYVACVVCAFFLFLLPVLCCAVLCAVLCGGSYPIIRSPTTRNKK